MKIFLLLLLMCAPAFASTAQNVRLVYSSTNVTTSAWVQLIGSVAKPVYSASIFDSSGQTLLLGVGPSGSITQILIPPGGLDGPLNVSQGQSISVKAVSATANTGEIDINLFY